MSQSSKAARLFPVGRSDEKPGFLPRNRFAFSAIAHEEATGARDVRPEQKSSGALLEPIFRGGEVVVEKNRYIGAFVDQRQTLVPLRR